MSQFFGNYQFVSQFIFSTVSNKTWRFKMNILRQKLLVCVTTLLLSGMSTSASAWSIEGRVDIVDLRSGNYNATSSYIYIAPKTTLPAYRYLVTNRIDRCDNLASDALGDNTTVIFQGSGTCATTGEIRRCPNVVTRCLSYRNR